MNTPRMGRLKAITKWEPKMLPPYCGLRACRRNLIGRVLLRPQTGPFRDVLFCSQACADRAQRAAGRSRRLGDAESSGLTANKL
jgi:hypothetical protein